MNSSISPSSRRLDRIAHRRAWPLAPVALIALCLAGCAQNRFYAGNLPPELEAPIPENAQTVELTNLAAPAVDGELMGPGDVLEVSISAGLSVNETVLWLVRIDNNGFVHLPDIGHLQLGGLDSETAELAIKTACIQGQLFRNPHVTVARKQQPKNRVMVIGAVQNPGSYELPRRSSDLLAAIYAAGGLSEDAGTDVEIRNPPGVADPQSSPPAIAGRNPNGLMLTGHSLAADAGGQGPQITRVNLVSATETLGNGYYVGDGGIVMVSRVDPLPIKVLGLVNKPGIYDFPIGKDLRVLDSIAQAGGVSSSLADKVYVIRRMNDEPKVIELSIRSAKTDSISDLRLAPGDTVSVEQTPATILLDTLKLIRIGLGASLGTVF